MNRSLKSQGGKGEGAGEWQEASSPASFRSPKSWGCDQSSLAMVMSCMKVVPS